MTEQPELIPVLQLEDLSALEEASDHLKKAGYLANIIPFSELPESEWQEWMTPANGGYLFYLEKGKYEPAMKMLGELFGYKE
jgi:hypothetical protein